ncbi:hypothetical protein EMIT053CA3_180044 [Pseudomonas donghuensis]
MGLAGASGRSAAAVVERSASGDPGSRDATTAAPGPPDEPGRTRLAVPGQWSGAHWKLALTLAILTVPVTTFILDLTIQFVFF